MSGTIALEDPTKIRHRSIITVCAMVATLMQALDSTIATVALPYIQGSLSASYDEITWVLTSYIVAAAIMTAPVGWLTARFGEKNLYLTSVIGFTVSSMLCGVATSLYEMVLFRFLQGTFGAALVPLSQATMLNIYPAEKRGKAMAIWGMGVMLGPILGPTLGGYLTDFYNWHYVFYVNVPFGIAATLGLLYALPRRKQETGLQFDWFGFAVLATGIAGLQLMLDRGEIKDWFGSTEIVLETMASAAGFYLFIVHMFTGERQMLSPALFTDRNMVIGCLLMFAVGMMLLASSALLPPWLQDLANYPVDVTGLLLAPRGLGTMLAMMIAGRVSDRIDSRVVMGFGIVLLAYSNFQFAGFTPAVNEWTFIINTIVRGLGVGLVFVPANVVSFATLDPRLRYEGTSLLTLVRSVGMSIGISAFEALITNQSQVEHSILSLFVSPLNRALQYVPELSLKTHGLAQLNQMINYQDQVIAYADAFWLMGAMCIPLIVILFLMKKPQKQGGSGHTAVID
jgi:MFS transporter, DHA2 family, multidrug resistance protein